MSDTLIRSEQVSKKFCRSLKRSLWYGIQDLGDEIRGLPTGGGGQLRPGEFWAVEDVNFELQRGECLGLIGPNGAGKTTLLRLLNGLIKPDRGRIEMRGRVGALIALGAGFNPILTGRENIYVNASVLGLSKDEIDARFDEIVEFAEIGAFIDTPVQNYSSGMNVRLGFAIATTLEPDILILDEVLAVGDIDFQIKCGHRIRRLASCAAVIFVSHNMQYVSWFCSRVMVLDKGRILQNAANPADGISTYFSMIQPSRETSGSGEAAIANFRIHSEEGNPLAENTSLSNGAVLTVNLTMQIRGARNASLVRLSIVDESGTGVITFPIRDQTESDALFPPGESELEIPLGPMELNAGKYSFLVAIMDADSKTVLVREQGLCPFQIHGAPHTYARIVRPVRFRQASPDPDRQAGLAS